MGLAVAKLYPELAPTPVPSPAENDRVWLAAYTRSRHEAAVARQLKYKSVTCLLPTYVRTSHWCDRLQKIDVPLFPGYVFVNVLPEQRVQVLQTFGVVNLVSSFGRPAPLSDADVAILQESAARPQNFQPHAFLQVGQRVRVKYGPFAGWEGILAGKRSANRLVVSLQQVMRSVAVNLDGADVEPVGR